MRDPLAISPTLAARNDRETMKAATRPHHGASDHALEIALFKSLSVRSLLFN